MIQPLSSSDRGLLKERLFAALNVELEFTELLGPHPRKSKVWPCFNKSAHKNEDHNASLSVDFRTSAWKCHACGEKGDIFTLYMRVKQWTFADTLVSLARKYNLAYLLQQKNSNANTSRTKLIRSVQEEKYKDGLARSWQGWLHHPSKLEWMQVRYGLTMETLQRWRVGLGYDGRVWIPVWANKSTLATNRPGMAPAFVNVRKHDCFRSYAKWVNKNSPTKDVLPKRPVELTDEQIARQQYGPYEPFYDGSAGKVVSIKDYGNTYLYPFEILNEHSSVYLVGGELKALLLWQVGIPAVCFTTGEGSYTEELLIYFLGKRVRVLMDPDEAGERAADILVNVLANNGALVQRGRWPEDIKTELPPKGDVTDYLLLCDLKAEALDLLIWEDIAPRLVSEEKEEKVVTTIEMTECDDVPELAAMRTARFPDLTNPNYLFDWVKLGVLVSGRSEVPFVVPSSAEVTCEEGKLRWKPLCASCPLPTCGFRRKVSMNISSQIEILGQPFMQVEKQLLRRIGTPKKCMFPLVTMQPAAAETLIVTPSVDIVANGFESIDDFEYRHHPAVLLSETRIELTENKSYLLGGRIIPEPRTGRFMLAVKDYEQLDDDILSHPPSKEDLDVVRSTLNVEEYEPDVVVKRLIDDLRDYHVQIYGQDQMIETALLAFFLPFTFRLGQYTCERICPSVMILGDTLVGKSTVVKKLLRLYGAGRFADMGSKPTFAGLVGGNLQSGHNNKMLFTWGLLPTSHRALLVIDEYNKLPEADIGALTNTLSSGVAERVTVNGSRRTLCHVRMLYLCNPRNGRSIRSFSNPMAAALQVAGSPQDLGRIEYVHVQLGGSIAEVYNQFHEPKRSQFYLQPVARTHLQWAWNLTPDKIKFTSPQYVLERALDLSRRFGHHTLLLPQQARFKLARLAAGFATIVASTNDEMDLVVRDVHVDMAMRHFHDGYARYLDEKITSLPGLLPPELIEVFDRVQHPDNLRFLVTAERWTRDDLEAGLGGHNVSKFIDCVQLRHGLVSRVGPYYRPNHSDFHDQIATYINGRIALMEATTTKPINVQRY